jgi:hypothetical protein
MRIAGMGRDGNVIEHEEEVVVASRSPLDRRLKVATHADHSGRILQIPDL